MTHILTRRKLFSAASSGLMASSAFYQNAYGQSIYNPNVTQLVQFSTGGLPILIVAPHGGTELVTGIPVRRNVNRPVPNFSFYGAVWTREICLQIERTLKQLSGESPYLVLSLAHRRYVDVNREESDAYEVPLNAPRLYWEYHDTINEYVNRMNVLYENPILIEITGQSDFQDFIVRRTLNGRTMQRLASYHAEKIYGDKKTKELEHKVYNGEDSIIGNLRKRGYKVNPSIGETDAEQSLTIAGDYTLNEYGMRKVININTIQLIIGSQYRKTANYLQTGRDFGNAIYDFAQKYLGVDMPEKIKNNQF